MFESAIFIAMLATGVEQGDKVLTNGFTFTALPSCILRIGANRFGECTENFTMDLDDLDKKWLNPAKEGFVDVSHARKRCAIWIGWFKFARSTE